MSHISKSEKEQHFHSANLSSLSNDELLVFTNNSIVLSTQVSHKSFQIRLMLRGATKNAAAYMFFIRLAKQTKCMNSYRRQHERFDWLFEGGNFFK